MRWQGRRGSSNVEDRRSMGGPVVGGGIGLLVLVALTLFLGGDPSVLLQDQGVSPGVSQGGGPPPADDEGAQFVSVVLADTEDVWNELFSRMGRRYKEPVLVLF